ncbi:MAG TPA: response regulator transcription factor [Solirubrobacteraceae bacterium]|nr:response regulator transcription factor [Solirubrobacteraceae bacterium]
MRVLVAEDQVRVAETVARGLRREGMAVDVALDGASAMEKARAVTYDVVVLDRDLPEVHGDDVCRALVHEQPATKVLMLTAARGTDDVVEGLALGADDYLPKPFRWAELVARLRALERRNGAPRQPVLRRGDVELDPAAHEARRAGRVVPLTAKELAVLEVLLAAEGRVVAVDDLVERVWDEHLDPLSNTVRMAVMTLRRKLGDPPVIDTVRGVGYRLP